MKSYTDLEQSKKLAELGIDEDTADMNYCNSSYKGKDYVGEWTLSLSSPKFAKTMLDMSVTDWNTCWEVIPAWSLSALLKLLPLPMLTQHINGKWCIVSYPNGAVKTSNEYDNPVDACYEMILKLKENKR